MSLFLINGKPVEGSEQSFLFDHPGFLSGVVLFESCRIVQKKIPLLAYHYARLKRSAKQLGFTKIPAKKTMETHLRRLIATLHLDDGACKILLTRSHSMQTEVMLTQRSYVMLPQSHYTDGVAINIARQLRSCTDPIYAHKSISRLWTHSIRKGHEQFFDTIIKNEKEELCEGTFTTILLCKKNRIATPPLSSNILPGVMRAYLLDKGKQAGLTIHERTLYKNDLLEADNVFLCNALRGLVPVSRIGRTRLKKTNCPAARNVIQFIQKTLPGFHPLQ